MSLMYYPRDGEVVQCDFTGNIVPEMVKTRPVIVIGPRLRRRGDLATIVPLSTTTPRNIEPWNVEVTLIRPLPAPFDSLQCWAACDLVASVSVQRLDRFKPRKPRYGKRGMWVTSAVSKGDLERVRQGVARGLGL
jgi:uncharacterized protein YifN (PemK superfamily)